MEPGRKPLLFGFNFGEPGTECLGLVLAEDAGSMTFDHVHPGEMDISDDHPRALAMFSLVNEIAEAMIARPKRLEDLYTSLPEGAKAAIERRDAPTPGDG